MLAPARADQKNPHDEAPIATPVRLWTHAGVGRKRKVRFRDEAIESKPGIAPPLRWRLINDHTRCLSEAIRLCASAQLSLAQIEESNCRPACKRVSPVRPRRCRTSSLPPGPRVLPRQGPGAH